MKKLRRRLSYLNKPKNKNLKVITQALIIKKKIMKIKPFQFIIKLKMNKEKEISLGP